MFHSKPRTIQDVKNCLLKWAHEEYIKLNRKIDWTAAHNQHPYNVYYAIIDAIADVLELNVKEKKK